MQFDFDPGLTVRVNLDQCEPRTGLVAGKPVEVARGMFEGLAGHVHYVEEIGEGVNVVIREGTPEEWEGR